MNRTKIQIMSIFVLVVSTIIPNIVYGQADRQETAVKETTKALVELGNALWLREYEEATTGKDSEIAATMPPKFLRPFKDWDYYYVGGEFGMSWSPNEGQDFESVHVPEGFVTDLASIPKILWSFGLRPEGAYAYPAVIHDFLYWTQERPREEADLIFLYAMEDAKVDETLRRRMYDAVRLAGRSAWESNRMLQDQGERRLLQHWPTDFTVSWAEWKSTPGVFDTAITPDLIDRLYGNKNYESMDSLFGIKNDEK